MSECVQGLASIETGTLYVRNRVNKRNCTITRTASRSPRAAGAAREPRGTRTRPRVRRARLPATRWRPIHIQHRTVARPLDPPAPAPAPHTNLDPAGARGCGDDCRFGLFRFFVFAAGRRADRMADRRRPAGRRAVSGPRGALPGSGAGGADPGSPARAGRWRGLDPREFLTERTASEI